MLPICDAFNPYAWAIALTTVGLAGLVGLPFWWLFQDGRRYRRLRRERAARVLPASEFVRLHEEAEEAASAGTCSGNVG